MFLLLKSRVGGAQVVVFKIQNWKPDEISLKTIHQFLLLLFEYLAKQPEVQENGIIMVNDLEGFRFEHFWALSGISEIRSCLQVLVVSNYFDIK